MSSDRPLGRRLILGISLAAIAIAVLEGFAYVVLAIASRALTEPPRRKAAILRDQALAVRALLAPSESRRHELDPVLGWRYRAGFGRSGDHVNTQGVRSEREYSLRPAPDILRVAAFGDSFVYGNEVETQDAWAARIEQQFPEIEVLNYGVGGYGVDQAYLRFRQEGMRLSPDVVIMGFVADDLRRLVNVYRRFISTSELPLVKPRFMLAGADSLVLLQNPLPDTSAYRRLLTSPATLDQIGRHDQWYEPEIYRNPLYDYLATVRLGVTAWEVAKRRFLDPDRLLSGGVFNSRSTAFRIQLRLFEQFVADVRRAGAQPLIVLFADRESLLDRRRGKPVVYAPLARALAERGMPCLDLSSAFPSSADEHEITAWFNPGGHYSPKGNALAAATIGAALRSGMEHAHTRIARADRSAPAR